MSGAKPAAVRDHAFELQLTANLIDRYRKTAEQKGSFAGPWLQLADAHLARARLAGGTEDHLAAEAAVAKGAALSPGTPIVTRAQARLLQRRHHFAEARDLLRGLKRPKPADQVKIAAASFELGEYESAVEALTLLANDPRDPFTPATLAGCLAKLGRFDKAEAQYDISAKRYHGREKWVVAWNHLVRGLMDLERNQLDDAMAHYQAADEALPGWWLVQEHIAEIHLEQGRAAEALALYEKVVAANADPELLGAMADALDALDREDEATEVRTRAQAGFDVLLRDHPDLAGTHALEFLLEHTPAKALPIARRNVELRPNGEAKLLLAEALDQAGQTEEAAALRADVQASGWWVAP